MVANIVLIIKAVVTKYCGNRTPPSIAPYISIPSINKLLQISKTNGMLLMVDFKSIFKNETIVAMR